MRARAALHDAYSLKRNRNLMPQSFFVECALLVEIRARIYFAVARARNFSHTVETRRELA